MGFLMPKIPMTNLKAFLLSFLLSTNYEIMWCGPGATNFQDFCKNKCIEAQKEEDYSS